MTNHNPTQIEQAVDNMTALCEQGREQVKELLRTLGHLPTKPDKPEVKTGQVWRFYGGDRVVVGRTNSKRLLAYDPNTPHEDMDDTDQDNLLCVQSGSKVADSLEEYFQKKFNQEL